MRLETWDESVRSQIHRESPVASAHRYWPIHLQTGREDKHWRFTITLRIPRQFGLRFFMSVVVVAGMVSTYPLTRYHTSDMQRQEIRRSIWAIPGARLNISGGLLSPHRVAVSVPEQYYEAAWRKRNSGIKRKPKRNELLAERRRINDLIVKEVRSRAPVEVEVVTIAE